MSEKEKQLDLVSMNAEITTQLQNDSVKRALLATTFKGLDETNMRKAAMEGMMRGFTFKSFLDKDVYALPFGGGYSLVESIDYCRKVGMRSGIVGKDAPIYTYKSDGTVETCSVTVKRMVSGYVGSFTSLVFFGEFKSNKDIWKTKPKMMIAKVAEMHALRMACPEELAHAYIEEEMESEIIREDEERTRVREVVAGAGELRMGKFKKDENQKAEEGADTPHQDDVTESVQVEDEEGGNKN